LNLKTKARTTMTRAELIEQGDDRDVTCEMLA